MTSALFIDGINHKVAELEIPPEIILFSLNLKAPDPLPLCLFLSVCQMDSNSLVHFARIWVESLMLFSVKHVNSAVQIQALNSTFIHVEVF